MVSLFFDPGHESALIAFSRFTHPITICLTKFDGVSFFSLASRLMARLRKGSNLKVKGTL